MSERDVTHSDLVEIAKRNGDFRKNYGVLVGAILYLRSINAARPRLFWWQNAEAMVSLLLTIMSIRRANLGLVSSFRLCEDAGRYITRLPRAEHEAAEWQIASSRARPDVG